MAVREDDRGAQRESEGWGVSTKTAYVVGFLFRRNDSEVALICKLRPAWQAGLYNGVGGRIEEFDSGPEAAVSREFKEEAGALVPTGDWRRFATLRWREVVVHFLVARSEVEIRSMTDEPVIWASLQHDLPHLPVVGNLRWLIPMALDADNIVASVEDPS